MGCQCDFCLREAVKIKLNPVVQTLLMFLILALFGLGLRWLLP